MTEQDWAAQAAEAAAEDIVRGVDEGEDVLNRDTDRANAQEFVRWFGEKIMWVPEVGWHTYDGVRWVYDVKMRRVNWVGDMTDALRARAEVAGDGEHADALRARVRRLESAGGLHGLFAFAGPARAHSLAELDPDPDVLNCPNGTLELGTLSLRPHSPEDLITRVCPTEWDPEADDETWRRVVWEALEGDEDRIRALGTFTGYTLTGRTDEKKFLVCHGPTNTGKSTVAEAVFYALGNAAAGGYATTWDADVVQADSQVNRQEKLDKARGTRLVLVGELMKGARMADNLVKQFTGGDTMDAKALYKGSYSFRPQAKLWMATNYVPGSPDPALHGRMLILPFRHVPRSLDKRIKTHLEDDAGAHRAVLAWAARGARGWLRTRDLGPTPWLQDEIKRYARDSDHVLNFIEDVLEPVEGYDESSHLDEVWNAYNLLWGPENVQRPLKRRVFERALEEHGLRKKKGTHSAGPTRWVGFKVRGPGQ